MLKTSPKTIEDHGLAPSPMLEGAPGAAPWWEPVQSRIPWRKRLDKMLQELAWIYEVLQEFVKRDVKVRYKRSAIGILWTMLNPLLMMTITTVVFANVFKSSIENFPIYMLSGYIVWGFFSQSTVSASSSILDSAGLTRKIYVPSALFPIASVVSAAVNLLLSLIPLGILMMITGAHFSWALLYLPFVLIPILLFSCGLGFALSALTVFFHDALYTYQVVLMAWMYLTPIFYPPEIIPSQYAPLLSLNPVFHMVEIVRAPVYAGVAPDPGHLGWSLLYGVGAMIIGWTYFERSRKSFVSYL